jgi:hypothetical protein
VLVNVPKEFRVKNQPLKAHLTSRYGSQYSPDSINNPYGAGCRYRYDSPNNTYGEVLSIYGDDDE